jgi:hypothetical protein
MPKKPPAKREKHATPPEGGRPIQLDWNSFQLICERLAECGSKYQSCEDLNFSYSTVVQAIKSHEDRGDDTWRDLWNTSYDKFRDSLEKEATRRARDGVVTEFQLKVNPATGERELAPKKVEYSDRLMEVLLKGHFPERFRERVHHSGTVGLEPVDVFANLSTKAKREIREIIMRDLEEQRELASAAKAGDVVEVTGAMQLEDLRDEK